MDKARNILLVLVAILVAVGCKEEVKDVVKKEIDPETTPTVLTRDVKTLISDSGITKYRITSPIWYIFERAARPNWKFTRGLLLEQFNDSFRVVASVKCDSATYFKSDQLWRLDGHVTILNEKKEVILTQQLFWDQRKKEVRSDSFIHIERAEQIIEGVGFKSNERMTIYELDKPMGIFPVSTLMRKDTTNTETNNQ